jgi:hypothetical protein
VTLIAGFKCEGGIVLCADTYQEASGMKRSVEKLIVYERDWCSVGFAGSGDQGDLIDTVVDSIQSTLDASRPEILHEIKRSIKDSLVLVYRNELAAFPQPPATSEPTDTIVTLLIAVKGKKDQNAELLLSYGTALHPVPEYEVRGSGETLEFVAERLFRHDLPLRHGVLLCTHLLGLSKAHVGGVGGESHIAVITNGGWIQKARLVETDLSESFFKRVDNIFSETLLSFADPSLDDQGFDDAIALFTDHTRILRQEYAANFQEQVMRLVQTDPTFRDAYQKLPEGTRRVFGKTAWRYRFDDETGGYAEPSPAAPGDDPPFE